jgi:hypothetical protein
VSQRPSAVIHWRRVSLDTKNRCSSRASPQPASVRSPRSALGPAPGHHRGWTPAAGLLLGLPRLPDVRPRGPSFSNARHIRRPWRPLSPIMVAAFTCDRRPSSTRRISPARVKQDFSRRPRLEKLSRSEVHRGGAVSREPRALAAANSRSRFRSLLLVFCLLRRSACSMAKRSRNALTRPCRVRSTSSTSTPSASLPRSCATRPASSAPTSCGCCCSRPWRGPAPGTTVAGPAAARQDDRSSSTSGSQTGCGRGRSLRPCGAVRGCARRRGPARPVAPTRRRR